LIKSNKAGILGNDFASFPESLEIEDPDGEFEITVVENETRLVIVNQQSSGLITLPFFVLKDANGQIFSIDNERYDSF
jgi:hypothetical protein